MQQRQSLSELPAGTRVHAADSEDLLDLRTIWLALRRNWLLIAIVTAATLLVTAFLYYSSRPTYVASAELMVERVPNDVLASAQDNQPVFPADSPTVDTAVAVLDSPDLLGRVVDRLRLTEDPEFNPDLAAGGTASSPAAARDRAIRILSGGLDVQRQGVSYAIAVNYASPEPRTAARIANAVMAAYLDHQREGRTASTERTARLLGARLEELRAQVLSAESAVAAYRARHQLFAATSDSAANQQQLAVLDAQLAESRAAQAAAEARLAAARGRADSVTESLGSDVVSGLRQQRAQVSAAAADLASRYGPRHPERVKLEQQVAEIDRQIGNEIARVATGVAAEASIARQRTASIAGSIGQIKGRLTADTTASVRLAELERNAESARAIYQAFLDNYRTALARQGTESSGATAISSAQVPVMPSDPNPYLYLLMGLIVAGILSGAAILIAETRRNRLAD